MSQYNCKTENDETTEVIRKYLSKLTRKVNKKKEKRMLIGKYLHDLVVAKAKEENVYEEED